MYKADLVIKNGKIATVDKLQRIVEAVAVRDGRIIELGQDSDVEPLIGPGTKVINAGGKLVLPGIIDSHIHAAHTGFTLSPDFLDFNGPSFTSLKDIQDKVAQAAAVAKPGEWVFGCGFVDANIKELAAENRIMNRWDLDPVSPDVPVALTDFSLHSLVCNSKALEIAGMDKNYPQIPLSVGSILRREDGELTGRFIEWGAENLLLKHCPTLTDFELEDCIYRVQQLLNSHGITGHNDCLGEGGEYLFRGACGSRVMHIYEKMRDEGKLTARVDINIFSSILGEASYDAIIRGTDRIQLPDFKDRNWVKADAVKFFVDLGGPYWLRQEPNRPQGGGRTAWNGNDEEQTFEISRTVIELHRRGWQMAIHAMGGRTMDVCIEAIAEGIRRFPGKRLRHFLIHADDTTISCAAKMAKLGISTALQPTAANIVFAWNTPVLTERDAIFNYQGYADTGLIQSGGSDATCFSVNWREGMQFAVTRTTPAGYSARTDLGMKREEVIKMYTINSAWQSNTEHLRGSVEIGKAADFAIMETDVLTCPADRIADAKVALTICDGKIVYEG